MKNNAIQHMWLPSLLIIFIFIFELNFDAVGYSFAALVLQSAIILHSTFSRGVNLLSVYSIFTLIFLSLIPWLHYSMNWSIWSSTPILESTYLLLNLTIFLSNLLVFTSYALTSQSRPIKSHKSVIIKNKSLTILALVVLSAICFSFVFYVNSFSILQLFFRGFAAEQDSAVVQGSPLSLLIGSISRFTPAFCFFYAMSNLKDSPLAKIVLFLLMLMSAFPTGVPRFMAAFVYIPVLLGLVPGVRKASIFSATLITSLIFAFPFLDQFRYFSWDIEINYIPSSEYFFAAHFDAYENFASAVQNNFITYGHQLLGVLFFYVPRLLWLNKPVGSGYEMANSLGYTFNNISMPFLGEGFVNFGYIGPIVFAISMGCVMGKIDARFAKTNSNLAETSYSAYFYYFLIGAIFFLLRGDLMSSTAFISAGIFSAFVTNTVGKAVNSFRARL